MATKPDAVTGWWQRISLRAKVTGVTVALLALGLLAAGIGTAPILRNSLVNNIDAQLPSLVASDLADRFFVLGPDEEGVLSFTPRPGLPRQSDYFIALYNAAGVLKATAGGPRNSPAPTFPERYSLAKAHADSETIPLLLEGENGVVFHGAVTMKETPYGYYVQLVVIPLSEVDRIVATYFGIFTTVALITILLAALLTRVLVTIAFRRLTHVESTAMRIASGDMSQRMTDLEPTTEVGRLNLAINTMLDRIDEAIVQRDRSVMHMRRFIGDASHELRTPLVSVRGYAELYRMGAITGAEDTARAMERIEKEAIRMGALVEDLLALTRLDEERELEIVPLDLRPIARDAALDVRAASPNRIVNVIDTTGDPVAAPQATKPKTEPIAPRARANWLRWLARQDSSKAGTVNAPPLDFSEVVEADSLVPPVVLGEEHKVRQVVANLLGNAQRFSPEDEPIDIVVGVDRKRGVGTISIVDRGEGIPPQIRDEIFRRFWRADTSRARETGGSGLGLAIVASIVSALGGNIQVDETPGGGATFTFALPLSSAKKN
jgi:two-component system OmpR family sensor kinase